MLFQFISKHQARRASANADDSDVSLLVDRSQKPLFSAQARTDINHIGYQVKFAKQRMYIEVVKMKS